MSTIRIKNLQLGTSGTASNNFVMSVPLTPDGTTKISRGNVGATTDDVLSIGADNAVTLKNLRKNTFVISSNTNAVVGGSYVLTASLTLTFPSSATSGDTIVVSNRSGVLTSVIGRNGLNIMGLAEDFTLDIENFSATFVYADATRGWVII